MAQDSIQPRRPTELHVFDVESAPEAPGIYAWYITTPPAPSVIDDSSNIVDSSLARLTRFAEAFAPEPFDVRGSTSYEVAWRATFEPHGLPDTLRNIEPENSTNQVTRALNDERGRQMLWHLLEQAVPHFASPAYIGVATNLRDRLTKHKADYEVAYLALKSSPHLRDKLRTDGVNLGARLAGASVPMERLKAWYLPVPIEPSGSKATQRQAAAAAEYYLQRLFRPALGRS